MDGLLQFATSALYGLLVQSMKDRLAEDVQSCFDKERGQLGDVHERLASSHFATSLIMYDSSLNTEITKSIYVDDVKLPDSISSMMSVRVLRFQLPTVEHRLTNEMSCGFV